MTISKHEHLAALDKECARQNQYWQRIGNTAQAQIWADLGDTASEAAEIRGHLIISVSGPGCAPAILGRVDITHPIPIKAGEYGQQVANPLLRNVLHGGKM